MTTTDFVLDYLPRATVLGHRVYWKDVWPTSWNLDATLHCENCTWSANPTIPTATLTRRYGQCVEPDSSAPTMRARKENQNRIFIKIEFDTISLVGTDPPGVLKWYGILEMDDNVIDGPIVTTVEGDPEEEPTITKNLTGRQHFQCYGLQFLLDRVIVNSSTCDVPGSAEERIIGRGLDFNFNGLPNQSQFLGTLSSYIFSSNMTKANRQWWSTKDAVQYLCAYQGPVSNTGTFVLKFELHDVDNALPTWDHVSMPTHGQSTWELLNTLISRQRLLGFRVEVASNESKVYVIPFTFTAEDIELPEIDSATIAANPNQITIQCDAAVDCAVTVKQSSVDEYDQVIVQGARRTSTCTLSFADGNIKEGWTTDQKTAYDNGASLAADYPAAAEVEERQWRNMEARKSDAVANVYSYFTLVPGWDGKAGNGDGDKTWVFPNDDNTANVTFYEPELFVLPRLNVLDGYDYGDAAGEIFIRPANEVSPGPHDKVRPVVLFPRHDSPDIGGANADKVWRTIDDLGLGGNLETFGQEFADTYSGRVEVPDQCPGLMVRITNDEQYVIAKADFVPLPDDPPFGSGDFRKARFTVCLEWDWYCQGKWPATLDDAQDEVRTLTLNFGKDFRCDYVVPGALLGVFSETGQAMQSGGGYVYDDRPILTAIARMAYEWYAVPRKAISLETSRVNSDLVIGQLLLTMGDPDAEGDALIEDVNSVITSIEIQIPYQEGEGDLDLGPAKMMYETEFGELDQIKYVQTYATHQSKKQAKW